MRFVHFSDFHIDKDTLIDAESLIIDALIEDLQEQNEEKKINLVFFTGDMVDKGGQSFGDDICEAFKTFEKCIIMRILDALDLKNENFIFVPGNHDIKRNKDSLVAESGLTQQLSNIDKVNQYINKGSTEGIQRIFPFKEFEKSFHVDSNAIITNYHSCYITNIDGLSVGIGAFNTAWRCYDSNTDIGKILLGIRQVTDANSHLKTCDVRIALMHHQFDCMAVWESDEIENLVKKNYDLLFCGHSHKGSSYTTSNVIGDFFVSISPANSITNIWSDTRKYTNGYAIVDFDIKNRNITVSNRIYSDNQYKYVPNTIRGNNDGKETYHLSSQSIIKKPPEIVICENENSIPLTESDLTTCSQFVSSGYNNISIVTKYIDAPFSINKEFFRECIGDLCKQSLTYNNLITEFESLITTMDRLLCTYKGNNEGIKFSECIECICNLRNNLGNDQEKLNTLYKIFTTVKWWLIKLKNLFETSNTDEVAFKDLIKDLIIRYEIDIKNDSFGEMLDASILTYDLITNGNIYKIKMLSELALTSQLVTCIVLPVYLNIKVLARETSKSVIGNISDTEVKFLVESINDEYREHLACFKGRDKEIQNVLKSVSKYTFTILKGEHGAGKSSIIASVVNKLCHIGDTTGFSPSIIVHSFKKSKSMYTMVKSIVEQCNARIVCKVDTLQLDSVIVDSDSEENKDELNFEKDKYTIFKSYINEVLTRITKECNEVLLVVDSVELCVEYQEKVKTLFNDIPQNVHLLLTTGISDECVEWITMNNNFSKEIICLSEFNRDEIQLVSGLSDREAINKDINDKIYEVTKGKVKNFKKVERLFMENEIVTIDMIDDIEDNNYSYFEKNAENWIKNELLEEMLLLLAVYEPIQPLSLEYIQLFLSFKELNKRMPTIRNELRQVDSQLSDFRFKRIKLLNNDFSDFVVKRFFSNKDISDFVRSIFLWQSTDFDLNLDFTCEFLNYIHNNLVIPKEKIESYFNEFIQKHNEARKDNRLYKIGIHLFQDADKESNWAIELLEAASEMNNSDAKSFLGHIYIKGENVDKNINKGEKLLREASNLGSIKAKRILGTMLIDGVDLEKNAQEGLSLLEEAIELGNKSAKLDLAIRLLLGKGIAPDMGRSQLLLDELVESNHIESLRIMGKRYLYGGAIERNIEKGRELLNKAISKGSKVAKLDLAKYLTMDSQNSQELFMEGINYIEDLIKENNKEAKRYYIDLLIEGKSNIRNIEKGICLLKELVSEGDSDSIIEYARILIEGKLIHRDIEKGKELLYSQITHSNDALRLLGSLLIDGKDLEQNIDEGFNLVYKAALSGDAKSKIVLATRYIYGVSLPKDFVKGEKLLKDAVDSGDIDAKFQYARAILFNKESSDIEKKKAVEFLEEASFLGNSLAKEYLGDLFLDGKLITRDISKGIKLLEESIGLGNPRAMRKLGHRKLLGIVVDKDKENGEILLRNAIELDDVLAKTILGHLIIMDETKEINIENGIRLLEEASPEDPNASRILGLMLVKGRYIKRDKEKGFMLLRKAIEDGDEIAKLELSCMLLDGTFIEKNVNEGKMLLLSLHNEDYEDATFELAMRLLKGKGIDKDLVEGLKHLEKLSLNGNFEAKYEYAHRLITGDDGVTKNVRKGEEILRELEALGDEDSRRLLAQHLINEVIKEKEKGEGITLLEKAIKENDYLSMNYLGNLLIEGTYIERDVSSGIQLLEKASKSKISRCKVDYALRLLEDAHIPKNRASALKLLKEAIRLGSWRGKFEFASIHIEGELVIQNINEGLQLLYELIEDGYERAKEYLATKLIFGDKIERNTTRGIAFYEELVANDNLYAMMEYAELLLDGRFIRKDTEKGEKLLKQVAQRNIENHTRSMRACYLLANRYLNADGLKKKINKGKERLEKAANGEYRPAMIEYGIRLVKGYKFSKNELKGNEYIENAIKKADADELHDLGVSAYTLKDYDLAAEILFKSYQGGSADGGTSLSYMLRRNEVKSRNDIPQIFTLLEKGLQRNAPLAIINLVLTIIKDEKSDEEWRYADKLIRSLNKCGLTANWWYEISKQGDIEGELVIGWLVKYNLIYDPDNIDYKIRLQRVIDNGLYMPSWMIEDTNEVEGKIMNNTSRNVIRALIKRVDISNSNKLDDYEISG